MSPHAELLSTRTLMIHNKAHLVTQRCLDRPTRSPTYPKLQVTIIGPERIGSGITRSDLIRSIKHMHTWQCPKCMLGAADVVNPLRAFRPALCGSACPNMFAIPLLGQTFLSEPPQAI